MKNMMSFQLRKSPMVRLFSTALLLMLGFLSTRVIAAELKLMASTGVYSVMQRSFLVLRLKRGPKSLLVTIPRILF